MTRATRFTLTALAFEAGLGLLATVIGWPLGRWPWATLLGQTPTQLAAACLWGGVATIPLLLALLCMDRWPRGPLASMKQFVAQHLVPLFRGLSVGQLGLLSLAAGVGEELLFRGLLQAGIAEWLGPPRGCLAGLAVASILFGVCHWMTALYAVLATIVGVYLGGLLIATDNLLTPIVAHTLYDFLALVYLVKKRQESRVESQEPESDSWP